MSVLLLSTADWDSPLWTNKQHLAAELAGNRIPTQYVESIGLRRPRLSRGDIARLTNRLRKAPSRTNSGRGLALTSVSETLEVRKPLVIPAAFAYSKPRLMQLNQRLLSRQLRGWIENQTPRVLWTFSPVVMGLDEYARLCIYHSVDLLHEVAGVPRRMIGQAEARLAKRGDIVAIASSRRVREHLEDVGFRQVHYWPNVADLTQFEGLAWSEDRRGVIFAGNLTAEKVDFPLLISVARSGVAVTLAGPVDVGARAFLKPLLDFPNVRYLGTLPLRSLASEMLRHKIGIIPYLLNSYTAGVFPMKIFEYLAAGLPVLATELPSLDGHGIAGVETVPTSSYVSRIKTLEASPENAADRAVLHAQARKHSWQYRMCEVTTLLRSSLTPDEYDKLSGA